MQQTVARIHRAFAWAVTAGLVLQVYLAGIGLFGAESLELHRVFGSLLGLPIIAMPILALAGRLGRRLITMSTFLVVLTAIQVTLPALRSDLPWIAALHAVNAFALLTLAVGMARQPVQSSVQTAGQPVIE